jgi:hypothetical protein
MSEETDHTHAALALARIADANLSDVETDDLTVPLAIRLSEVEKERDCLVKALEAARPEIERQRDRCNSDQEVAPFEALLSQIDAALDNYRRKA